MELSRKPPDITPATMGQPPVGDILPSGSDVPPQLPQLDLGELNRPGSGNGPDETPTGITAPIERRPSIQHDAVADITSHLSAAATTREVARLPDSEPTPSAHGHPEEIQAAAEPAAAPGGGEVNRPEAISPNVRSRYLEGPNATGKYANDLHRAIATVHISSNEGSEAPASTSKYHAGEVYERFERFAKEQGFGTYVDYVAAKVLQLRNEFKPDVDTRPTPKEKETIVKLHDGFKRVGDQLGIDLAHRLPDMDHHHFFDSPEDYVRAAALTRSGVAGSASGHGSGRLFPEGVLVVRDKPLRTETTTAHEIGHDLDLLRIGFHIVDGRTKPLIRPGYFAVTREVSSELRSGVVEFVDELLKNRVFHTIGSSNYLDSYGRMCMVGANVLTRTAKAHGLPPVEVEDMLLKGSLAGDMTGLALIADTLGEEGALRFLRMNGLESREEVLAIADELGLSEAKSALKTRWAGIRKPIFTWERPRLGRRPFGI